MQKNRRLKLKDIRLYKNTAELDTSSYVNFCKSVFKDVPKWFWFYIILISAAGSLMIKESSFFIPKNAAPEDMYPIYIYTFFTIILLPVPLVYIRFIKPFSFYSFYMGIANTERDYVKYHNKQAKENAYKVYTTDSYKYSYDKRSRTWNGKNIDAEERFKKRHGISDMSWFIKLMYGGFLIFFLLIYMMIMYHIIVPVTVLVALHIYYKYKKLRSRL